MQALAHTSGLTLAYPSLGHAEPFARDHFLATRRSGWENEARHNEGVYLTLCSGQSVIAQITSIKVMDIATVDAPGVIISCHGLAMVWFFISAWALTLSVRL